MVSVKTFVQISGVIFFLVGLIHLLRLLTGLPVVFGTWDLPLWVSILGAVLAWYLAYTAFVLSKKKTKK